MNLAIIFSGIDNGKGENMENNYASLDMSKFENVPTYESLINTQNNMVRFLLFFLANEFSSNGCES